MTLILAQGVGVALLALVSFLSLCPAEVEEWPLGNVLWPGLSAMQQSFGGATKISRILCTIIMLCSAGLGVVGLSLELIEKNEVLWKVFIGCTFACELCNMLMGS